MRGFTLIELMIIMTITLIVGISALSLLPGFRSQNVLELATQELISQLRDAQGRAISQDSGTRWGVHFAGVLNDADWYAVFSGNSYAVSGTTTIKSSLPTNLKFLDPAEGVAKDVVFSKVTGAAAPNSIVISLIGDSSDFNTININANGVISYTKSQ